MESSLGAEAMLTDHEPPGQDGPLTPALSPSEGERGNHRQVSGEARFMGRRVRSPARPDIRSGRRGQGKRQAVEGV